MEIDWFGLSCFRLRAREATVVTDPYEKSVGLRLPRPRADLVTISHNHAGHDYADGVAGNPRIIQGPGEYEISSVFVTGVQTFHDKRNGKDRGKNTVYAINIEGIKVCHLGDIGHVPSQAQADEIGEVDILLVPVGGGNALNASDAAEVVSLFEPMIVIPMHYRVPDLVFKLDALEKFVKEMGVKAPMPVESYNVKKDGLPKETQLVILDIKQKE
ncbi:MAG: MBL fold metallo-hydrolase [Anaerolineae bacterium]|nr:MBL fold metallo-hydrolase [Anaerolineae bacterium]